jgi:hypothetical protein
MAAGAEWFEQRRRRDARKLAQATVSAYYSGIMSWPSAGSANARRNRKTKTNYGT